MPVPAPSQTHRSDEVIEIRGLTDIPLPLMAVTSISLKDRRFDGLKLSMRLHRAGVYVSSASKNWHAIIPYAALKFIQLAESQE